MTQSGRSANQNFPESYLGFVENLVVNHICYPASAPSSITGSDTVTAPSKEPL